MLTRRQFTASLAGAAAASAQATRLNVLLITNDQLRADCLGAMGNRVIRTPNLDRLAAEGTIFEQYYAQCPQCVPSRAAMHTGRYPHVNRTPSNAFRLPDSELTLATILGRQGYTTAVVGELPFAPTNIMGGFQQAVAGFTEYQASLLAEGYAFKGVAHAAAVKKDFQATPSPWPDELDESAFFAARAIDFLRNHRDKPFFLHVNYRRPHHPFDPPPPFDTMYAGATFPASHKRAGEMRNKPPGQQKAIEDSYGFDLRTLIDRDLDRVKSYYYGMISENDKYIGKILDHLRESGLEDRTLVIFNADHGEMLGDHGLLYKGGYMYDEVVRIPLILRAPGKVAAGKRVKALAEQIDLAPTVLELLGLKKPAGMQGQSLLSPKPRRAVHSEFANIKMLRTEEWKLVHYLHAPYGELYNLREDPHELENLYDDAGAAKARHEMESELADWLIDSSDPLLAPFQA
jgi:arylsulfatase A-like enzyme